MKKSLLIFSVLILLSELANTQQSTSEIDPETLENAIEEVVESNYIRIPQKDFDSIIDNEISKRVNSRINQLIGITVAAIGLFSGLSLFQNIRIKNSIQEDLSSRVSGLRNEMTGELREYIEKSTNSNIEPRFKNFERFVELEIKTAKSDGQATLIRAQQELNNLSVEKERIRQFVIDSEFKLVEDAINTKRYSNEDIEIAERLLHDLEELDPESNKIIRLVDLLCYAYYDKKMYVELDAIITKYQDRTLSANTFIHGALAAMYDYHTYATNEKKIKALDYLDRSLQVAQAYGEALGLKLEIFMMDYLRNEDVKIKNKAIENADKVIKNILSSASDIPSYETIYRLSRDIGLESYQNLIDTLYELFTDEMHAMLERANRYDEQRGKEGFTIHAITTTPADNDLSD